MATIQQFIELDVPAQTAYDQWTHYESLPEFMKNVKEVRRIDDTHLHWIAEFGGRHHEWDAEIDRETPGRSVAWHSSEGERNQGYVWFLPVDEHRSRVMVKLEYDPHGVKERLGEAIGAADWRVHGDLKRFKKLVERG